MTQPPPPPAATTRLHLLWQIPLYFVGAVIGIVVFAGIAGTIIEGIGENIEQHDRCLKQATNGYDIRECGR